MTALMTVLGIVVFAIGLLFSIAWHELGHLSTAKLFGIRVPQYMVGFGPTIFSRRRGDTEYGIKAIPLGGYIRMIGMFPPGDDGRITARATSPFRGMIESARSAAFEELQPGDEERQFYTRAPWKRVIVMFAGPFMNLLLAVVLFLLVLMGFGLESQTTTVSAVEDCVISQSAASAGHTGCPAGAPPTPAKAAGLKAGDRIVAFDGRPIQDWNTLQADIRRTVGPASITVVRHGRQQVLHANLIKNQVAKINGQGGAIRGHYVTAGFLGFTSAVGIVPQSFSQAVGQMHDDVSLTVGSLVDLPARIPALWRSAFDGAPRSADSPMGVVGAARVGGEVFTLHIPPVQRVATMLMLVAGFNLSLFLFNMLPLLPLDGGHIAGALWEAVKRRLARVLRRPDPGPFDVAKMMPVAYVVAGIFLSFTVLVLVADVVNPVKIT